MPVWTLKTPRNDDPKELLKFLQELIQYLKYITEHLDDDNVPSLKELQEGLNVVDNKYKQAFDELEVWKDQIDIDIADIKAKIS